MPAALQITLRLRAGINKVIAETESHKAGHRVHVSYIKHSLWFQKDPLALAPQGKRSRWKHSFYFGFWPFFVWVPSQSLWDAKNLRGFCTWLKEEKKLLSEPEVVTTGCSQFILHYSVKSIVQQNNRNTSEIFPVGIDTDLINSSFVIYL